MPPFTRFLPALPRLAALSLTLFIATPAFAAPAVYVDAAGDFSPANPAEGATVTWKPGTANAVAGLVFGTDAFTSIRSAVTAVDVGGSIHIAAGTYNEGAQINISKSLSIEGDKGAPTVLSGNNERRIFSISGSATTVKLFNLSIIEGFISASGGAVFGGAIFNNGSTLEMTGCTVANSRAGGGGSNGYGGAISNYYDASLTMINCTISGCRATYAGGAISSIESNMSLIHTTITSNSSSQNAGGLSVPYGSVTITNSIIAGNLSATQTGSRDYSSFSNSLTIRGMNFIGAGITARTGVMTFSSTGTSIGDVLNTTLADNGGPTFTHALVQGSPAIGAGDNASIPEGLTTDQRGIGFDRISKDTVDIGAVEMGRPIAALGYVGDVQTLALDQLPFLGIRFNQPVIKGATGVPYLRMKHGDVDEIVPIPGNVDFMGDLLVFQTLPFVALPPSAEITLCFEEGAVTNIHGDTFELTDSTFLFTSRFENVHVGHAEDFLITAKAGSDPGIPEPGDRVTWKPGTSEAVENLIFGANAFFGTGRFGSPNSIHDALELTHPGGTVFFPAGTFYNGETLNLTNHLTLQGDGATKTFLSGGSDGDVSQDTERECRVIRVAGSGVQAEINDLAVIDGIDANSERFNYGGGLQVILGGSAVVNRCVFSRNYSQAGGGAIFVDPDSFLTVNQSTFSGNSSELAGGAIGIRGSATLINSTVSGNSALSSGGGISVRTGGALTLHHCTVADNASGLAQSSIGGGGISVQGTATLNNTLVAGNTSQLPGTDISGSFTGTGVNFIGELAGASAAGPGSILSFANTPASTISEVIAPLADIGGQTQVHPLAPASPAIDAGSNATIPVDSFDIDADGDIAETLPLDQTGFVRVAGTAVDIGAVEFVPAPMLVTATITDGDSGFNVTSPLSFTFDQEVLIDTAAIRLRLAADGSEIPASIVHAGNTLTITPNATLSEGTGYYLDLGSQSVSNLAGTSFFYGFSRLDFSTQTVNVYVDAAGDFSPANPADGATVTWKPGTANAVTGLTFGTTAFANIQGAVNAVDDGGTVHVANGTYTEGAKIDIAKSLTLQGDGALSTILSGVDTHTVIETTGALNDVVIQGFSITRGFSGGANSGGSGIRSQSNLTLNDCAIHGNLARNSGGGIYHASQNTTLTLNRCTLSNNTASDDPISAAGIGGAIMNLGTLVLNNSTLSGNYARNDGGAINSQSSSSVVVINHSTIVGNDSDDFVGGVYFTGGSVTINNSIVAGNTANSGSDLRTGLAISFQGVNFIGNIINLANFRPGIDLTFANGQTLTDLLNPTLANNGGSTPTHALRDDSPAVDSGDNNTVPAGLTTDQRGKNRIIGGTVDIGAFEAGPPLLFVHRLAGDFTITNDQGNPGLDAGDTVTWNGTSLGAPVPDLIFGTDAFLTVAEAITAARENATIHIAAGTFQEGGQLTINKNLTLRGDGPTLTSLSGNGLHRVLQVSGTGIEATLRDLAVVDGYLERFTRVTFLGAGIENVNADLSLINVRVANNRLNAPENNGASPQGAGLANQGGSVRIDACVFENNVGNSIFSASVGGYGRGGAIYNAGTLSIRDSLFDRNQMTSIGPSLDDGFTYGAAIFHNSGVASVVNTTFTGHSVSGDGSGETIHSSANFTGDQLTIVGSSNSSKESIRRDGGVFTLRNSIVVRDAPTTPANELVGTITSQNNLIGLSGTGLSLAGVLADLAENGGPTRTHSLVPGCPAVNTGNNELIPDGLDFDQRGYPRILDGTVDIGAVEFTPAFVLPDIQLTMDPGLSGKIHIGALLGAVTGGGGLPLTLLSFSQPGHLGSVVRRSGDFLVYQSAPGQTLADSFTYTFTDGIQTRTGTITVELDGVGDALTFNITSLVVAEGVATIRVAGIPGIVYQVESSETMAPASWSVMGEPQTCPPGGIMTFTDPGPLPPGRFYRAVRVISGD